MNAAKRIPAIAFGCWLAGALCAHWIGATAANVLALVVPGALLAWASRRLPASSSTARIGAWLLLVSALAFAAQGLFAFDPADPDAFASRMRVLAWTLWWIAFAPGALLQAVVRRRRFLAASALAVALACAPALLPLPRAATPLAQLIATLAWFGWWFAALRRSAPGRGAA
jgi:hypothetical protein